MKPYGMPRSINAREDSYWWRHWGHKVRNFKKRARQQGKKQANNGLRDYDEQIQDAVEEWNSFWFDERME